MVLAVKHTRVLVTGGTGSFGKAFIQTLFAEYEYIDLDKCSKEDQKEAVEQLKAKKLPVAFPIIMINDAVIQGFKKDKILEELGI